MPRRWLGSIVARSETESATESAHIQARANYQRRKLVVNIHACIRGTGGGLIGPIRGNSWWLLISLSLRLRVPGSVLRQLPANRDTDLFLGAAKMPYTFRDLDRYWSMRESPIRVFARYQFFLSHRIVRQEEFVIWEYREAFEVRWKWKMKREKVKKAKKKKNGGGRVVNWHLSNVSTYFECFYLDDSIHIYMFNRKEERVCLATVLTVRWSAELHIIAPERWYKEKEKRNVNTRRNLWFKSR